MKPWTTDASERTVDGVYEHAEQMIGSYHPADRPTKWRALAEFCAERARVEEQENLDRGVPER